MTGVFSSQMQREKDIAVPKTKKDLKDEREKDRKKERKSFKTEFFSNWSPVALATTKLFYIFFRPVKFIL